MVQAHTRPTTSTIDRTTATHNHRINSNPRPKDQQHPQAKTAPTSEGLTATHNRRINSNPNPQDQQQPQRPNHDTVENVGGNKLDTGRVVLGLGNLDRLDNTRFEVDGSTFASACTGWGKVDLLSA
jgi:uncharacterized protein YifN (PemK superfamily)